MFLVGPQILGDKFKEAPYESLSSKQKLSVRKEVLKTLLAMTDLEKRWREIPTELAKFRKLEQLIREDQAQGLFKHTTDMDKFIFFRFGNEHDFIRWSNDVYFKSMPEDYVSDDLFKAIDAVATETAYLWQLTTSKTLLSNGQQLLYTETDVEKVALILGIYKVLGVREVQQNELKVG